MSMGSSGSQVVRASGPVNLLRHTIAVLSCNFVMGHSRLITNGETDNQPIERDSVFLVHNGIIINETEMWQLIGKDRQSESDTEVLAAAASAFLSQGMDVRSSCEALMRLCSGSMSVALAIPERGELALFSNTGSLYIGFVDNTMYFASEKHMLERICAEDIEQVTNVRTFAIPRHVDQIPNRNEGTPTRKFLASLGAVRQEEALLEQEEWFFQRCSRCILPETMPFISFNSAGVCNYCLAHQPRNQPTPVEEFEALLEQYRRPGGPDCIFPFSGGRDSSYGLHLVVKELKLRPITYTYDWGMITDLGRRNISRMTAELGVENIVVAADIAKKRRNIARNLKAWLEAPHLGLLSLLTAGDKHFYRYIEHIKRETGISLNVWSINPLETTHFKTGFLGIPPEFESDMVYRSGLRSQLQFHSARFRLMTRSPRFFNASILDTLSGEYFRSIHKKSDYYHLFDFFHWNEDSVETVLDGYEWERAPDSRSTWRIGDGSAAFYNYVYYSVAGFTEHDTFRSNQIREGQIDRARALELVAEENRPRYPNLRWYIDCLGGFDFTSVIRQINAIGRIGRDEFAGSSK